MAIPAEITDALSRSFPSPRIDPAWLTACIAYLSETLAIPLPPPKADIPRLIAEVTSQLLQSNLSDSMIQFTGLPRNISPADGMGDDVEPGPKTLGRTVLVEVLSITEIGSSAFTLAGVKQAREDRADLGLDQGRENGEQAQDEEDEGPIPMYPRSMLRFILSDGSVNLNAIEYKRLSDIQLGVTPLGFKMLLLPGLVIRRGIAYLSPATVQLKGHQTEDHEVDQLTNFDRHLRIRRGIPEPENENAAPPPVPLPVAPLPARARNASAPRPHPAPAPTHHEPRSPLRALTPPDHLQDVSMSANRDNDDEEVELRHKHARTGAPSSSSRYFSADAPVPTIPDILLSPGPRASTIVRAGVASSSTILDSDDFGFDDEEMDDAMLQALARAESATIVGTAPSSTVAGGGGGGVVDDDIIEIDSDEDDKENVPVPGRRVRPRVDLEVIDISD